MGIYWRNGWAWGRKEVHGIEYREPLGARSKREAEQAYARWVTDLQDRVRSGKAITRERLSFAQAVNHYTEHHFPTLKPGTRRRYLHSLLNLTPHFKRYTLDQIGKAAIAEYVSARRQQTVIQEYMTVRSKKVVRKGKVSDSTIKHDLMVLSGIFTVAQDFDLCEGNPAATYIKLHQRRKTLVKGPPRTRYLSHAEEKLLLDAALARAMDPGAIRRHEKAMIAAAFALYIDLGFRSKELLNARRSWIDLARNEITVPGEHSKTGKARTVPLLSRARRIIEMLPAHPHSDLLLWRTAGGRGFSDLRKTLQKIAASIGIKDIDIHDLRRTCGCRLLQDHRMRMAEVSSWLGHASVQMTESTYAFLRVEDLHDAIGGRVEEKAARLRLAEMFDMQFYTIVGTKTGTRKISYIEKK